jgi:hypothetical protein
MPLELVINHYVLVIRDRARVPGIKGHGAALYGTSPLNRRIANLHMRSSDQNRRQARREDTKQEIDHNACNRDKRVDHT